MDLVCEPIKKPKNPLIEKKYKVRKDLPREMSCTASSRACCIAYENQPCDISTKSSEIDCPNSEKDFCSGVTEFCERITSPEELCVEIFPREPCGARVEKRLRYSEREISCFIEIIVQKLREFLGRVCEPLVPEAKIYPRDFLENNVHGVCFAGNISAESLTRARRDGEEEKVEISKDSEQELVQNTCGSKEPVILRPENKREKYSCVAKSKENLDSGSTKLDFRISDFGRSEEVGKWGELDIADRLLPDCKQTNSLGEHGLDTDDVFYEAEDKFDELNRFLGLNKKRFATICRHLFRWSNRLSKNWRAVTSRPHVVIHLPSVGYPYEITRRASRSFDFLQNRQIFRLGWLGNENAQVLYIVPSNQSLEMITWLRDLVKNVRPDVAEARVWIIQPDSSKTRGLKGSRALFQSPKIYQRVKMLTAGRQAFLLPGIIEQIDVLIASELRVPIIGPPMEFQNHFLNKSNVANFLKQIKIDQPPFVSDIHNPQELCDGLAHLIMKFRNYVTWLIKINYGINGLQTALINFNKNSLRAIIVASKEHSRKKSEKKLAVILMEILPGEMILNEQAYKSYTEFYCDLEKYGGLVQGCPPSDYRVISLGVYVEHDTATPLVCASADVFHDPQDLTTDLCYGIPQATTARLPLESLVVKVGIVLRDWQYIGYFGIDILVLGDEDSMDKFLVVDVDPHYTDVIALTDWVRFCLEVQSPCQCCQSRILNDRKSTNRPRANAKDGNIHPGKTPNAKDTMERYAICSGRLYSNGLAKYCGTTLVSLCEERNVGYNSEIKQGSMICPIDAERRALGLVSLFPTRSRAIREFVKSLRVLHELSLEKRNDKIKTNMLKLARALERRELGINKNFKKNETFE